MNKEYLKNKNTTPGKNTGEYIVLHHTGSVGDGNIKILAGLTDRQVSVHYLVRQDGTTYQFVDEDKIARHCGLSEYKGRTNLNTYSIGIEVESDGISFTDRQRSAVSVLIRDILTRHKSEIIRHKDITSRKTDIGDNFRFPKYPSFENYVLQFKEKKMTNEEKLTIIATIYNLEKMVLPYISTAELKKNFEEAIKIIEKIN